MFLAIVLRNARYLLSQLSYKLSCKILTPAPGDEAAGRVHPELRPHAPRPRRQAVRGQVHEGLRGVCGYEVTPSDDFYVNVYVFLVLLYLTIKVSEKTGYSLLLFIYLVSIDV